MKTANPTLFWKSPVHITLSKALLGPAVKGLHALLYALLLPVLVGSSERLCSMPGRDTVHPTAETWWGVHHWQDASWLD